MQTSQRRHTRLLSVFLAGTVLLGLSGCSTATTDEDWHAIANGVDADIGGVEIRSLLIVSEDADQPGRFLGTLFNTSTEPVDVILSDEDDRETVHLEAQGEHAFDTNPLLFSSVSDIPGSRVRVTVTVASEEEELSSPVLDGTLQAYRPFLPSQPAAAPSATPK